MIEVSERKLRFDDDRPAAQSIPAENGGGRRFVFKGDRDCSTGKQEPKFTKDVSVLRADYAASREILFGVWEIICRRLICISAAGGRLAALLSYFR